MISTIVLVLDILYLFTDNICVLLADNEVIKYYSIIIMRYRNDQFI